MFYCTLYKSNTVELQLLVYHDCFYVVLESLGKIAELQIWDSFR